VPTSPFRSLSLTGKDLEKWLGSTRDDELLTHSNCAHPGRRDSRWSHRICASYRCTGYPRSRSRPDRTFHTRPPFLLLDRFCVLRQHILERSLRLRPSNAQDQQIFLVLLWFSYSYTFSTIDLLIYCFSCQHSIAVILLFILHNIFQSFSSFIII